MSKIAASVIVPTYNRPDLLEKTLRSLGFQTMSPDQFEVVVVDDGSAVSYESLVQSSWPYSLQYVHQANQGEIVARQAGVQCSRADFFVFLDDDIEINPDYLAAIFKEHQNHPQAVLLAVLVSPVEAEPSEFQKYFAYESRPPGGGEIPFTDCMSGVMAVHRDIYNRAGGLVPLGAGGRNAWGGMDFAYRAYQAGATFRRCLEAVAVHNDYALRDLPTYCERMRKVSQMAVMLFQRYPELVALVPMFRDKTLVNLFRDPIPLVFRKIARRALSSKPALGLLKKAATWLEKRRRRSGVLWSIYRWIIGGAIYQGYHEGLKKYGNVSGNIPDHRLAE